MLKLGAEDIIGLERELVLQRAEVERLTENVEEACGEKREDFQRVEGGACGDEGERAGRRKESALGPNIERTVESAYLTAWLCISADCTCVETGFARCPSSLTYAAAWMSIPFAK